MEDTGFGRRVLVLVVVFLLLGVGGKVGGNIVNGGYGVDSFQNGGIIVDNVTESGDQWQFLGDVVIQRVGRDPGSDEVVIMSDGLSIVNGNEKKTHGKRKEIGEVVESRSSVGGSKLSLHDGEVSKSTFELSDNHERKRQMWEETPTHLRNKSGKNRGNVTRVINDARYKKVQWNGEKLEMDGKSELSSQDRGQTLVKRDVHLSDNDEKVELSDRIGTFRQQLKSGVTLIHPGQGGVLPVFSPDLAAEESQEFPRRVMANQFQHSTNDKRKQDLFMSFQPILFQQVFPNNLRFRPETIHQRPNQPPRLNQGRQHLQRPIGHFQNTQFRNPHANIQINTHRPVFLNEFPASQNQNNFFTRFNQSLVFRPNVANGQGRFPVVSSNRPTQIVGPWSFEEERPQPHHGPLEEFEFRLPEKLQPGSVVFEPPAEDSRGNGGHFDQIQNHRPGNQRPNHHQNRRPPQGNQFQVVDQQNRPWSAFTQVVNENPTRPNFPPFRINPSTQSPTRRPTSGAVFNPVTGQKLVTRLPINSPSPHLFTPSAHFHQSQRPTTPRPHPQFNSEQFFVPSKDPSNLPFDFPSSFANSNSENDKPHQMVFRPNFHSSEEDPRFKQTRPWFTPGNAPQFSRPPEVTTPRPTHSTQRPVHLSRPSIVIEKPVTSNPVHIPSLSKPFFPNTQRPQTTSNDHSQFTPSFVPTTPSTPPVDNNFQFNHLNERDPSESGITVQPDPAIIPPKPPFLLNFHTPSYIIPPLKANRTTTPLTLELTTRGRQSEDFPLKVNFGSSTTSFQSQSNNLQNHNTFGSTTSTPRHVSHFSEENNNFGPSSSTISDLFKQNDQFFASDVTTFHPPRQTSTRHDETVEPTTKNFRTTDSTRETTLKPPHQFPQRVPNDHANEKFPMNKFLTPLVKFRDETVTENSFVPNSAVKITPKAIATPEFNIPQRKPSSPDFTLSTHIPLDFDFDEDFDSLVTPDGTRSMETDGNFDFTRTSSRDEFFPSTSTALPEAPKQEIDDDEWMSKLHTSIPEDFFSSKFPKTTFPKNTVTKTTFIPNLRFPNTNAISTPRPLPPITTFRPTEFNKSPQGGNQFIHQGRPPSGEVPQVGSQAVTCKSDACQLPNCFCGGNNRIPGDLSANEVPQLVLLTFDDDVNEVNWNVYHKILYTGRQNPNGCPIQTTFYVSHEWTDYSKVQTLYADGHEIASHSISHPDGASFSKQKWKDEIQGQREILSFMGGIPIEEIQGMRAPFLAVGGNKMFGMLYESNFTYDSSLPVPIHDPPFWPYTLDYSMGHDCMIPPCPRKSFPGLWEIPMVMWVDLKGGRCSMADACSWPETKERVYETLMKNFQRHYKSNRAPFNLFFHSAWFDKGQNMAGFLMFMDRILTLPDVYFVTSRQAIEWIRQPTPLREIHSFVPFSCHLRNLRASKCKKPRECQLKFKSETRYVRSCQQCPAVYPWIKNTHGKGN